MFAYQTRSDLFKVSVCLCIFISKVSESLGADPLPVSPPSVHQDDLQGNTNASPDQMFEVLFTTGNI